MNNSDQVSPSFPSLQELMWLTLKALAMLGGSASIKEIEEQVALLEGFTEEQMSTPMSSRDSRPRIPYRLAWARTYLRNAGAVENTSRGVWALTEDGKLLTESDIPRIVVEVRDKFAQRKKSKEHDEPLNDGTQKDESDESYSDDVIGDDGGWKGTLLAILQTLPPDGFERLCQCLLREAGFTRVEVTGKGGDGGIDGVGILRVSLVNFQVYFQAKRYQGTVSASVVRDFRGAMVGRADKGLLITTGTFSPQAYQEATRPGAPSLDLIDGTELCELLKKLKLGVTTELVERTHVLGNWFDQFRN